MPIVLRNAVVVEDPLRIVLAFVETYRHYDFGDSSRPGSFGEADLRLANRGGARISAAEQAAILDRRPTIERALHAIPPDASLADARVAWQPLRQLFESFADLRGVGLSKTTKALHRKRPSLVPILDSVVQGYLEADDAGAKAPFAERGLGLVTGYKRDLDRNLTALRAVRSELGRRGYELSEVRILDLAIWSAHG